MPFALDLVADTHPDSDPVLCLMRKNGEVSAEVPLRSREWAKKMVVILRQALEEDREAAKVMMRSGQAMGHSAKGLLTLILQELLLARSGDPERFIKRANAASVAQAMFDAAGGAFRKDDFNYNGVATMVNQLFPGAHCTNKAVEEVVELLKRLGHDYDPDNGGNGGGRRRGGEGAEGSGTPPDGTSAPELGAEDLWQQLEDALAVLHAQAFPESRNPNFEDRKMTGRSAGRSSPVRLLADAERCEHQRPERAEELALPLKSGAHSSPSKVKTRTTTANGSSPRVYPRLQSDEGRKASSLQRTSVARLSRLLVLPSLLEAGIAASILLVLGFIVVPPFNNASKDAGGSRIVLELPALDFSGSRVTENFSLGEWTARETITIDGEQRVQSRPVSVRVAVLGVPEELLSGVILQLKADKRSGDDSERSPSIRNGEVVEVTQAIEAGSRLYFVSRSSALEEAIRKGFHPTIRIERMEK